MVEPPRGSARPAQHFADLPTHGGTAEHSAARKHRALATIRALAARLEIAGRGMETTDSRRLTVTPAAPAASDALRAPRYPRLRTVQDRRSPSFSDRELEEGERLALTEPTSPAWARLPSRRGGRADRCAGRGSRYRPRSAMALASSNRIVKRMHKVGFGLGQPPTLGLRLSRFRGFPLSGDLPASGTECRGCAPADADVHGRGPPAGRSGAPATAAVASVRAASIPLSAGAPNRVRPFSRWAHPLYRYRGSARARIGGHRAARRAAHRAPARARLALAYPPRSCSPASRHRRAGNRPVAPGRRH